MSCAFIASFSSYSRMLNLTLGQICVRRLFSYHIFVVLRYFRAFLHHRRRRCLSGVHTWRSVWRPVCIPVCKPGFETLFTYLATPTCMFTTPYLQPADGRGQHVLIYIYSYTFSWRGIIWYKMTHVVTSCISLWHPPRMPQNIGLFGADSYRSGPKSRQIGGCHNA